MIRRVIESAPLPPAAVAALAAPRPVSLKEAYAVCERIARAHTENFPVASRFLPAHLRPHVWALYAFARSADDFADEAEFAGRRGQALARWEENLERAFHGEAEHPVFIALRHTVEKFELPIQPFQELLTAFTMDLSVNRYPTWSALDSYIQHAAHPIGRTLLYIFGYRDPQLHRWSDDICSALLVTNLLQDVAIDLEKDRVYLPEEDLRHFGLSSESLYARAATPAFRDLMRFEVAKARALYERGRPLLDAVGKDLGFELALIWCGGVGILDKIEAVGFDVFRRRPTMHAADKAMVVARAATMRRPSFSLSRPANG